MKIRTTCTGRETGRVFFIKKKKKLFGKKKGVLKNASLQPARGLPQSSDHQRKRSKRHKNTYKKSKSIICFQVL